MDNKFFKFLEEYEADIRAFFEALKGFIEALMGKLGGNDTETEAE